VKRDVHERDGEQCTFVSADGVRCTERAYLELDHTTPVARGGQPTLDGTRHLCSAHNQYEAERILGADFMRAKRDQAIAARELESELTDALTKLGFKKSDARRAVASCDLPEDKTFDQRLRAALATLTRSRCQEAMPAAWASAATLTRACC
jgi:hypothetical protein